MPITELSISSLRLPPIFVARISSGRGGGETAKEGKEDEGGEGKKGGEERMGSIGRDAIPDCEPSETRRRENPGSPLYLSNLLFKRVENSRFFYGI